MFVPPDTYSLKNIYIVNMAESQLQIALSESLSLKYKISSTGSGYILLTRSANDREYKQCLFSNSWGILETYLGAIAIDLHDGCVIHMPNKQIIKIYAGNVQMHFVDGKSGRGYSFWLTQQEFGILMSLSNAFKISQHLGPSRSLTYTDIAALNDKLYSCQNKAVVVVH